MTPEIREVLQTTGLNEMVIGVQIGTLLNQDQLAGGKSGCVRYSYACGHPAKSLSEHFRSPSDPASPGHIWRVDELSMKGAFQHDEYSLDQGEQRSPLMFSGLGPSVTGG